MRALLGLNVAVVVGCGGVAGGQPEVAPIVETAPVPTGGDAADDAAVWVHPADPAQSLVIGTDKDSGLGVYDLDGAQLQFIGGGEPNNVDVRYGFPLGGKMVDIVAVGDRTDNTIRIYRVDVATRALVDVTKGPIHVGTGEAYGFCLYRSPKTGLFFAFVTDDETEQWQLVEAPGGLVDAVLVRSFEVGSQTEGVVADEELGWLYVGEEEQGIWRYGAEPDAGNARTLVDDTGDGQLTADVEGLSIYYASDGTGYLIASSQGSSEFVVYQRVPPNEHVLTFAVGPGKGIDAVSGTDGLDVSNVALGPSFPFGLFVAQDDENDGRNQNFKLVPWDSIATAGPEPLIIDTTWDPRGDNDDEPCDLDGDSAMGSSDLLVLLASWGPCPQPPEPCPADVASDDGHVGTADLLAVIAGWGPCPGGAPCPWDCSAPADRIVGTADLLATLAQWGQEMVSCDVDREGVGTSDLLMVLANWGECS